jgi:hypothetical protein
VIAMVERQAKLPLWVIRDRVKPAASPAMSAMPPKAEVDSEHRAWTHYARSTATLVRLDQCGNSRQRHIIEEWLPGQRFTVGLVKLSILQKLTDTSEVFTKE